MALPAQNSKYFCEGFVALLVLALGVAMSGSFWPLCRFKSEVVTLTVADGRLHVSGLYRYEHNWPLAITQGFSCPFPVGDGLGDAGGFVAELLPASPDGELVLLPVSWLNGTPYFQARIAPGRVTEVRIRYTQPLKDTGKYFLTTTRPWGRALEHGRYELNLLDRRLAACNYPCKEIEPGRYAFERVDFLPEQDWVFKTVAQEQTP